MIDQIKADGTFNEHKTIIGPDTEEAARALYLAHYPDDWTGLGAITSMPVEAFKAWALDGKKKRKPLAYVAAGPDEFVTAPDGSIDFGEITHEMSAKMRRQAGSIRLERGNANYGLQHIEDRHGAQIRSLGFDSVEHFVFDAARHIDAVWQPSKTKQMVVLQSSKRGKAVFVELKPADSGDYYTINTAFPVGVGYAERKEGWKLLWGGSSVPAVASGANPLAGTVPNAGEPSAMTPGQSSIETVAQFVQMKSSLRINGDLEKIGALLKDASIAYLPRKDGVSVPNKKQWDAARKQIPVTVETRRVDGVPDRLADVTLETYEDGSVRLVGPSEISSAESAEAALEKYARNYANARYQDEAAPTLDDVAERIADDTTAAHVEDGEAATPDVVAEAVQPAEQAVPSVETDTRTDESGNAEAEEPVQESPGTDAELSDFLNGDPIVTLPGGQAPTDGFAGLREWVGKIFAAHGNKAESPEIGEVLMDMRSVRDSLGHGLTRVKAESFAAVPDVIERGRVVYREPVGRVESIYISAPVRIAGVDDIVTVLVHRDMNTQRMYLHSVIAKESLLGSPVSGADAKASERSGLSRSGGIFTVLHSLLSRKSGPSESSAEQTDGENTEAERATSADTLTPDQATRQMEWRDMGQRDGERRHRLMFKEDGGEITVATLSKFGKGKWQLDDADLSGEIESYDGLREAKKAGQARALKYLEREGYVAAQGASEAVSATEKIEDVGIQSDVSQSRSAQGTPDADKPSATGIAGITADRLKDVISERFPGISSAVDAMLKRGEQAQRGGLVILDTANDDQIAKAFAKATGRTLGEARESLNMSRADGVFNRVRSFVVGALKASDRPEFRFLDIGPVSDETASAIKKATGLDVSGYTHTITGDAVRHIKKQHGNESKERGRGQVEITNDDIAKIPSIVAGFDSVRAGDGQRDGRKTIVYQKAADNGHTFYVEVALVGRKKLASMTMWKTGAAVPRTTSARGGVAHTSETLGGPPKKSVAQSFSDDNSALQGIYDPASGLTFLIGANLTEDTAPAVLLHEITHSQQRKDIDAKALELIERNEASDGFIGRVRDRMRAAGVAGQVSESAAYIVEQAVIEGRQAGFSAADGKFMAWVDSTFSKRVGNLVRDFVAMVRAWGLRHGIPIRNVAIDDLVELAKVGAKAAARGDVASGNGDILYSRAIDNTNFRTKVFTALAKFDEFFEQPTPSSKSLKDIAHEIDAGFRVEKKNKIFARHKTNGKAVEAWEIFPRGQDVRSAYVFEDARGRVWLDVSRLKPGADQGTKVYGIVAGYAHNNGKVFIGDPAGLSESGFHRRLESMISSALKYGTTDHLYPHAAQTDPAGYFQDQPEIAKRLKGLGIDWKEGDFAHNLTEMLEASYNATVRHTPAVKNIIYDFDARQFVDAESGARRSRGELASLPRGDAGGTPDSSRGGSRTYARAAIYNTLVRGRSKEARRRVLAQLSDQLSRRVESSRLAQCAAEYPGLMFQPKPFGSAREGGAHVVIVLGSQPPKGAPMHAFRLPSLAVEDAGFPSQSFPDLVRASGCAVIGGRPLAGIGQTVTVSAREDHATVEDRHAPATSLRRA